ncbi:MAG: NHL repeat-containing protein, partial [Acidobacteriaceae bacterium]|nr:NHL repeat-containing protein [Acidobacteriaceae bacterium]
MNNFRPSLAWKAFRSLAMVSLFFVPLAVPSESASAQTAPTAHLAFSTIVLGNSQTGFGVPTSVAVDSSGNVYVADYSQSVVKMIPAGCTAEGIQSGQCAVKVLASGSGSGTQFYGARAVAVDRAGNVFVLDIGPGSGGDGGLYRISGSCLSANPTNPITCASSAMKINTIGDTPTAVATDSAGNVYVTQNSSSTKAVIKFAYNSGSDTYTVAGLLAGGTWSGPNGVAVDSLGNVYVADAGSAYKIIKVPYNSGTNTYGAPVTLTSTIPGAWAVAVDGAGDLYVGATTSGGGNGSVMMFPASCIQGMNPVGCSFTTPIQGLSGVNGLAIDNSGNLYVADYVNDLVLKLGTSAVDFGST